MAKTSSFMLLVVLLCGLVMSFTLADPTMYGAAAPAKYPSAAPVPYPANKYETPATTTYSPPNKYETPTRPTTTTAKYETPKYEKKMEEYPTMKYGPPAPPAKKYRRAADVDEADEAKEADDVELVEEEKTADPAAKIAAAKKTTSPTARVTKLSAKNVKLLRDAVIESLLSDPTFLRRRGLGLGIGGGGFYRPGGFYRRPSFGLGFGGGYFDDEDDEFF